MESKSYITRQITIGFVALIVSIIYLILSFTINVSNSALTGSRSTITPDLLPKIIAVVAIVSALYILVPNVIKLKYVSDEIKESKKSKSLLFSKDRLVFLFSFMIYIVAMKYIGYIISTIVFAFVVLTYLDRIKIKRNLVFALLMPIIIYFLFNNVLQIWLPVGYIWN